MTMQGDIAKVLIDREAIATRIAALAAQITDDLERHAADTPPTGDIMGPATASAASPAAAPHAALSRSRDENMGKLGSQGKPGENEPGAGAAAAGAAGGPVISLTLVPVLTGSIVFVADLIRHLPVYMQIQLISISSYPGRATSSRGATLRQDLGTLPESLAGRHVLLIDDILDSGRTLRLAADLLRQRRPASLRTCVLLRKERPEAMACPVDYVCFDIPDVFVVGYGLDFNDYYRNLPEIVTLRPEVVHG